MAYTMVLEAIAERLGGSSPSMGTTILYKEINMKDFIYRLIQNTFKKRGTQYYGDGGTIHSTGEVNVELDKNGKVVSVWFRCALLPFTQHVVDDNRAKDMRRAYSENSIPEIRGLELKRHE